MSGICAGSLETILTIILSVGIIFPWGRIRRYLDGPNGELPVRWWRYHARVACITIARALPRLKYGAQTQPICFSEATENGTLTKQVEALLVQLSDGVFQMEACTDKILAAPANIDPPPSCWTQFSPGSDGIRKLNELVESILESLDDKTIAIVIREEARWYSANKAYNTSKLLWRDGKTPWANDDTRVQQPVGTGSGMDKIEKFFVHFRESQLITAKCMEMIAIDPKAASTRSMCVTQLVPTWRTTTKMHNLIMGNLENPEFLEFIDDKALADLSRVKMRRETLMKELEEEIRKAKRKIRDEARAKN